MTKRNVEAYAAAQQPLCVQNDTIPESLFQEYGVNRGLRDANGVGVLTGLTNISKIVSFQNVGGKRMPCEGQLWYRGYNIKDLIGGLGPQEFGFEKIAYLLVFGQMPTPEELAVELDMTPEKVVEVQKYGREPISLHTPLGEDGDSEFGDLIEDSEAVVPADAVSFTLLQEQLHAVLDTLSEREAGVVSMRFGLTDGQPKTLDEIGKVYGVTRERIRQIESKTMSKLRHPSRSQVLRDYLD